MATYHTVTVTYNGSSLSIDYWADGNGCDYYGYATSLDQLQSEVRDTFGVRSLDLYAVGKDGSSKLIKHDRHIKNALKSIRNHGVLCITAYDVHESDSESDSHDGRWNHGNSETGYSSDSDDDDVYEKPSSKRGLDLLKHFTQHTEECYHCERSDFSGVRYEYSSNSGYSLCGKCYNKLSRSQKRDWNETRPWGKDVPDYPLYREDDCPVRDSVRHLQYLYTYIGVMPLNATAHLQGSYQTNTEKATEKFRKKYRIYGDDMTVYDKKTARKLAQVVYNLRHRGYEYL